MNAQKLSGLPPSIIVSSRDFDRLEQLLDSPALRRLPAAVALMEELKRATVMPPDEIPDGVVTMHSTVECDDELTGEHHRLTLVYPHEANVDSGLLDILWQPALEYHRRRPEPTQPNSTRSPCRRRRVGTRRCLPVRMRA